MPEKGYIFIREEQRKAEMEQIIIIIIIAQKS